MDARHRFRDSHGLDSLPGDAEAWANFPDAPFYPEDV